MTEHARSGADERRHLESFLRTSAQYFGLPVPPHRALGRECTPRTAIHRIRVPVRQSSVQTMPTQF